MSELFAAGELPETPPEYRVLARKYRPASFAGLLGQEAMVRTLGNAIARGQLAQAWLLTGVRGVGKTSTARIIAKALNCVGPDGGGGPTIEPCGVCEPCASIAAGRHIDVIEMDAASNTGIDNIREIIEAVRYAAVSARYKIYIIDEVHMLSKPAFNGLLKTLEEPPPHCKFILATTEVGKVPVTILSRCQRFDLRRVAAATLTAHFADIVAREHATAEPEALALIARAAEGSVRDGLSILDQAIAHGGGTVDAATVRDMLGLADRGAIRALLGRVLDGDAPGVLADVAELHALGADPGALIEELLETVHAVTRLKVADTVDPAMSAEERAILGGWATGLAFPALHRLWQLLLKGQQEVRTAPNPRVAAEMALLRAVHASELPDPGELVRRLQDAGERQGAPPPATREPARAATVQVLRAVPAPAAAAVPAPVSALAAPSDFPALVARFEDEREARLAQLLRDEARLVRYAPPELSLAAVPALPADFAARLRGCLERWTGANWTVSLTREPGQPTLREAADAADAARRAAALADPGVQAVFAAFPDAELIDIEPLPPAPAAERRSL